MGTTVEQMRLILELQDRVSGNATRIDVALSGVAAKMNAVNSAAAASASGGGLEALAGKFLGLAAAVKAAGLAFEATKGFAGIVLSSAQFRENTLVALKSVLGTREAALDAFDAARRMALQTPLETRQVVDYMKSAVVQGFTARQAFVMTAAAADMEAADPGHQAGERFIRALSQIKAKGKLQGEEAMQLMEAGMSREKFYANIATLMGITGSKDSITKQVEAKQKKGGISADVAYTAAVQAVQQQYSPGGQVGDFSKSQSGTLTGVLSNLKSAADDLLQSVDISKWTGIAALKDFLLRVTAAFNPATESGRRMLQTVMEVTDALFGGLTKITSSDIEGFLKRGMAAAREFREVLTGVWERFRLFSDIAGVLGDVIAVVWDLGKAIVGGLVDGASPGIQLMMLAFQELFGQVNAGSLIMDAIKATLYAFGWLAGTVTSVIAGLVAGVAHLIAKLGELWDALMKLIQPMQIFNGFGKAWEGLMGSGPAISKGLAGAAAGAAGTWGSITKGLSDAWAGATGNKVQASMQVVGQQGAQGLIQGASGPQGLDTHSPSRRMRLIGIQGAQGLAEGAEDGMDQGRRDSSTRPGRARAAIHIENLIVQGGSSARQMAYAIRDELEDMAVEAGVF